MARNLDEATVGDFGREWASFDQSGLDERERRAVFEQYFAGFPWEELPAAARGFDLGCGSGRWAALVAPKVGELHCVDASAQALDVARRALAGQPTARFHHASVDELPFADGSMDFGYSLGVLHHVPDTAAGVAAAVRTLKPGAPFLVYLYYAFDDKPAWFRGLWRASDGLRRLLSRAPHTVKLPVTTAIAALVYWPLARVARLAERGGREVGNLPLSFYRSRSFYVMRTDALDRFGTRLEQRFTRPQIEAMLTAAGLERVVFSDGPPFWCATGRRVS